MRLFKAISLLCAVHGQLVPVIPRHGVGKGVKAGKYIIGFSPEEEERRL